MKKLRIIIFEDDKSLASLIKQVLLLKDHDVQAFSDPTACPIYRDNKIECPKSVPCADVIISDHMMPNMTGLDFLKLQKLRGFKAQNQNKALITGSAMHADSKHAIDELGCHYIKKPFRVAEVLRWVDECAERLQ